jgi:hypothetical protein
MIRVQLDQKDLLHVLENGGSPGNVPVHAVHSWEQMYSISKILIIIRTEAIYLYLIGNVRKISCIISGVTLRSFIYSTKNDTHKTENKWVCA